MQQKTFMSVIYYKEGEHGGGFEGFRVARTIGGDANYRQRYFSLNRYSYAEANKLANTLDEKWKKETTAALNNKRILSVSKKNENASPHIIVEGFRAAILVERKKRAGETRTYYSPGFYVKKPGYGQSNIFFRVRKHGYQGAYIEAAKKYSDIHGLSANVRLALIAKKPNRSLFTNYLLQKLTEKECKLTKKTLNEMLA